MASPLSQKTQLAWRAFVATPQFAEGIRFLREDHAPKVSGKTATELLEASLKWGGYMDALNDVEDVLTAIPEKEAPIESPGLEQP